MNADDLRRILAATPDEPDLPVDRVARVHRRSRAITVRRRGTAGALAVAVLAAVVGTAVALPSSHGGGDSDVHVVAPSSGATSPGPTPGPGSTTAPATVASTSAPTPSLGLPFTWSVHVTGDTVSYGGSWSGDDRTITAADLAADPSPSTFAEAGSGVLGLSAYVTTTDGSSTDAYPGIVYESNGGIPACSGPVVAQHRSVKPGSLTITQPGTYLLHMHSYTCSGERDDTRPFTIGPTTQTTVITQTLSTDVTTIEVGKPLTISFDVASTVGSPGEVIDVVGEAGPVGRAGPAVVGTYCKGSGEVGGPQNAGWTFSSPGTYVVMLRVSCSGVPAETGPPVPQSYTDPGPVPGFGGDAADALALARADPTDVSAVIVHVVAAPGSGSPTPTSPTPTSPNPSSTAAQRAEARRA